MDLRTGHSLWQGLQNSLVEFPPLEGDARTELAIIGGGVTGALLSSILVQHGIEVLLVDKRHPTTGSTAASTGLLQYEVDTPLVELIEKVGQAAAVHAYRRGVQAIDELEELAGQLSTKVEFERRRSLYLASTPADVSELREEFECLHHFGFETKYLDPNAVREVGNLQAPGAILSAVAAQINPLALTAELLEKSAHAGVRIHGRTAIEKVLEHTDHVELQTETGVIQAKAVVFATGYEANQQFAFSPGTLKSTFAVAARATNDQAACPPELLLWETARPYFYARHAHANQYVIIGGHDVPQPETHADERLLAKQAAILVREYEQRFPGIKLEPHYVWAGTFAETADGLAYIGKLPDRERCYAALGYGGNGITFSMIAARLIRDVYTGRKTADAEVFSFARR
jgi:glycine/D-amino acid oxidase-like deaminating enzyme